MSAGQLPRPLIGLTGRVKRAGQVSGFPATMADVDVDLYVGPYARAVSEAGGLPVHLPMHVDPADYIGRLDGVLLTGGADVAPGRFGAAAETDLYPPEPERDELELGVIDLAVADGLAVLGICRGLQLLNVWGGGTLHQHAPAHARDDVAPTELVDTVVVEPGSRLHDLYGDRLAVNSLHHQTVDRVAEGWWVTARSAADATVEAMEWPGRDMLAVQWHPEMLPSRASDPVFGWLVAQASLRVRAGAPRHDTSTTGASRG